MPELISTASRNPGKTMNDKLTAKLNEKYPKMFLFYNFRSANHFIFECGDGWYNILNAMFGNINSYVQHNNNRFNKFAEAQDMVDNGCKDEVPQYLLNHMEAIKNGNGEWPVEMDFPTVKQIKEKFGTLRAYIDGGDNTIAEIIHFAETMSNTTCEECGNIGTQRQGSWMKTLCDRHEIERQTELAQRAAQDESFLSSMVDRK